MTEGWQSSGMDVDERESIWRCRWFILVYMPSQTGHFSVFGRTGILPLWFVRDVRNTEAAGREIASVMAGDGDGRSKKQKG